MATFKQLLWTLAAFPLLTACSSDDFADKGGYADLVEGEGVYMTVNFSPVNKEQTRSYTNGDNSSNTGVETGTEEENNISRVLLVLTNPLQDNKFIAAATVENNKMSISTDKTIYQATAKFEKTMIADYYGTLPSTQSNPKVNVFVYCNPSPELVTQVANLNSADSDTSWLNWTYDLTSASDGNLWTANYFPMSNVSMATRNLPASFDAWNLYTTEANPFDLSGMNNEGTDNEVDNYNNAGSINVQRSAVRFDFRDGSQMDADEAPNGNGIIGEDFTYAVMTSTDEAGNSHTIVKATIVNMSLVNMLNSEYLLERVSSNGLNENINLLGAEKPWFQNEYGITTGTPGNYVVSAYADKKVKPLTSEFGNYFFYPFFDETGKVATQGQGWYTTRVEDVVANKDGQYPTDGTGFYNRWRYVTENTIPGENANQVNSWTTGIVFKAKLKPGDALTSSTDTWDIALNNALASNANGPILYFFSGKLYCGWEHVQAAALAAAGFDATKGQDQTLDRSATLFKAVYGNGGVGIITNDDGQTIFNDNETDAEGHLLYPVDTTSPNYLWGQWNKTSTTNEGWVNFRNAVIASTFTIYQKFNDGTDGWGYYCYYYYWNRHNDNGQNGVMAPMEFATVRNNVYKLAVTRLNTLGHPRIPENDPNTPTPDTPDEKSDLYLTVSVQVVPWVVRFNNIEFW